MSETETLLEQPKSKKDRPRILHAHDVLAALRLRYPTNAWALLAEVGNSTGFKCRRHADAVVMGLWPSRGMEVIGIEIKVRRSDWLKELEQPEKADIIAQYCDRWFVAVGDPEIVKEGELPPMWGLLVPKDEKMLRCAKDAPLMPDVKPLDRNFIASILRQAQEQLTSSAELSREFARGVSEGLDRAKSSLHFDKQLELGRLKEMKKRVDEFQKASGVNIEHAWKAGEVGEAVKMVMHGVLASERKSLTGFKGHLEGIISRVNFALEKMEIEPKGEIMSKPLPLPDGNKQAPIDEDDED